MSDPRRMQSTTSQRQPTSGPRETISFACGGWLKMYEFGVAKALQEVGVDRNMNVIGCSAGALAATALALECNLEDIRDYVIGKLVHRARDLWSGPFKVREYCAETLDACANLERVHRLKSDPEKLTIVYSSLSAWTSRRVSQFDSPEHLKMSLLASTCAVPIGGMPFKLNGEWVMDGGLFDFQPVFDKKTITVSPFFCMAADIKPSRYVPMWWAVYAPSQRDVEWLFDLGYEDGLRWIVESGRAQGKHIKIPTKGATYDGEWTTTVGRVIGYRGLESRVLDVLFVAMFVILWKPIAFSLLYTELCLQAVMAGSKAVLFAAASKLSVASIVMGASVVALLIHNAVETMPAVFSLMAVGLVLCVCAFVAGGMQEAASLAAKDWQKCCTCVRSIASLSLFLRSMPVVGSTIKIKRHDHLVEHSLVYRVALHFV